MHALIKYSGQSRRKPPFLGGLSFAVAASLNKFRRSGGEIQADRIDCLKGSASGVVGNDEARKVTVGVKFSPDTVETHFVGRYALRMVTPPRHRDLGRDAQKNTIKFADTVDENKNTLVILECLAPLTQSETGLNN